MNRRLFLQDFIDKLNLGYAVSAYQFARNWPKTMRITYYGKKVVMPRQSDVIILFEHCEYCGGTILDELDCCASCGAPAYL